MEQLNVGTVCSGRTDNASATPALDALCRAYALTQCVHPLAPPGQRNCTADCAGACLLGLDRSGNHTGALALYLDAAAYAMAIPLNSVDPTAAIERRASVAALHFAGVCYCSYDRVGMAVRQPENLPGHTLTYPVCGGVWICVRGSVCVVGSGVDRAGSPRLRQGAATDAADSTRAGRVVVYVTTGWHTWPGQVGRALVARGDGLARVWLTLVAA